MLFVGSASSIRTVRMGTCRWTARSTSRRTCGELLEAPENTSTMIFEAPIASMISAAHSAEGAISRGATHTLMPCASSCDTISKACERSGCEYDTKTSARMAQGSRSFKAFSRLIRMRSKARASAVISVLPRPGKFSAGDSPRLKASAMREMRRSGRTVRL